MAIFFDRSFLSRFWFGRFLCDLHRNTWFSPSPLCSKRGENWNRPQVKWSPRITTFSLFFLLYPLGQFAKKIKRERENHGFPAYIMAHPWDVGGARILYILCQIATAHSAQSLLRSKCIIIIRSLKPRALCAVRIKSSVSSRLASPLLVKLIVYIFILAVGTRGPLMDFKAKRTGGMDMTFLLFLWYVKHLGGRRRIWRGQHLLDSSSLSLSLSLSQYVRTYIDKIIQKEGMRRPFI